MELRSRVYHMMLLDLVGRAVGCSQRMRWARADVLLLPSTSKGIVSHTTVERGGHISFEASIHKGPRARLNHGL